jgi:hypothetical protein
MTAADGSDGSDVSIAIGYNPPSRPVPPGLQSEVRVRIGDTRTAGGADALIEVVDAEAGS